MVPRGLVRHQAVSAGCRAVTELSWRALRPVFLDFEAASAAGWPIEVGWAEVASSDVVVESYLIRPEPEWDEAEWDEVAAEVHGIAFDRLFQEGRPASLVADRVAAALSGRLLVSDAAEADAAWLARLMEAHGEARDWPVTDLLALERRMDPPARARLRAHLASAGPAPHRAGEDAARLARAWLAALGR